RCRVPADRPAKQQRNLDIGVGPRAIGGGLAVEIDGGDLVFTAKKRGQMLDRRHTGSLVLDFSIPPGAAVSPSFWRFLAVLPTGAGAVRSARAHRGGARHDLPES